MKTSSSESGGDKGCQSAIISLRFIAGCWCPAKSREIASTL